MTRIVGGIAGGRTLLVPQHGTRPTSDRVREALFSSLDSLIDLNGARVLDLYAGSGAVGLEAASRGASRVALVDSGREAALVLRHNVDTLGLAGVEIHRETVESFLGAASADSRTRRVDVFDLVFADPPYAETEPALAAVLAQLTDPVDLLASGAVVVVERGLRTGPPSWPIVIQPIKNRRYGDSVLWYGRRD